jgi:hypothetical protein
MRAAKQAAAQREADLHEDLSAADAERPPAAGAAGDDHPPAA